MHLKGITRRKFLQTCLSGAALLGFPYAAKAREIVTHEYDLAILNARVMDPRSGLDKTAHVGIRDKRIEVISDAEIKARTVINAEGFVVSPGFIDVLADNTRNPEVTYSIFEKYKVTDGVTTVLQMHGGTDRPARYYRHFSRVPHYTNFGASTKIMNIQKIDSLKQRLKAVRRCLDEGALGVSMSPEYIPLPFEEMLSYAKIAKGYDVPVFIHTRYSSPRKEIEGVDEAIRISRMSGAKVHIDHINSTGGTFHMEEALERISKARNHGMDVTASVYPYEYWATYLHSRRFDPGWKERYGIDYSNLLIVGKKERMTRGDFHRLRKQLGIVVAVLPGAMHWDKVIYPALREDFVMIASDGGIESEPRANNHPRGAGTFSTAIRHGLKAGLDLRQILKKMTCNPADLIGKAALKGRGRLVEGAVADLVVFDPQRVKSKATVENPNQYSDGIHYVIVGGRIAVCDKKLQAMQGEPIRLSRPPLS